MKAKKYTIVAVVVPFLFAYPVLAQEPRNGDVTTTSPTTSTSALNSSYYLQSDGEIPMVWPYGTYGLMEAATGCPGSYAEWAVGWRHYDTEDHKPSNSYSPDITALLAGTFHHNNLVTNFCIKTHPRIDSDEVYAWPSGTYCILKYGICPAGFQSGYINWDDEDHNNQNDKWGTLPDGSYGRNTRIYYCCRSDGSPTTEIYLPRDMPFVLIRYTQQCQAVHGMNLREVYIRWDDEDGSNRDYTGGAHPYDNGGSSNNLLHFCHYISTEIGSIIG